MYRSISLLFFALSLLPGCKKSNVPDSRTEPLAKAPPRYEKIDACGLLTKEDVAGVQATEILETKGSENGDGALLMSQCYYSASESSKSVSLAVSQNNSKKPGGDAVADYWKQTFGRFQDAQEAAEPETKEKTEGREEGEKETPPRKIAGLGEEAYWAGNRFGGALYVLKKDVVLRLSVGGPGDPAAKLERSRALAEKALPRL